MMGHRCIELFDEITHGRVSRRYVTERLAMLAGGAADLAWGRTVKLPKENLAE